MLCNLKLSCDMQNKAFLVAVIIWPINQVVILEIGKKILPAKCKAYNNSVLEDHPKSHKQFCDRSFFVIVNCSRTLLCHFLIFCFHLH